MPNEYRRQLAATYAVWQASVYEVIGSGIAVGEYNFQYEANGFWHLVTYKFRHLADSKNGVSILAAVAVEAARQQGQFGPLYQALFVQPTINQTTLAFLAIRLGRTTTNS